MVYSRLLVLVASCLAYQCCIVSGFLLSSPRHPNHLHRNRVSIPSVSRESSVLGGRKVVVFAQEGDGDSTSESKRSRKEARGKRRRVRKDQAASKPEAETTQSTKSTPPADADGDEGRKPSFLEMQTEEMLKEKDEVIKRRAKGAIKRDLGG